MERARERARAVLRVRDFRFLLASRLISQFGDGIFQAFLIDRVVFLSTEKGTTISVAKAFAVLVIPFSLVGPLTGVVIDRWSRRRILSTTALIRGAAALGVVILAQGRVGWPLYVFSVIVLSLNRFYLATAGTVLPSLVSDERLLVANSLSAAMGTVATFAGLVIGTQIAGPVGTGGLLAITVVCWPVSAFLASRIGDPLVPGRADAPLGQEVRRVTRDLARGARRLVTTPAAIGSITSISFDQLLVGLVTVLSVVVFKHEFRQGVASYGRIVAAGGVGVLVGSATVGLFEGRLAKPRIMALAFALAGAACLVASVRIAGPTILLISFVLGLTYPWRKVPADTLVQHSLPDRYRGRVFAIYDMMFAMPRVIAALLAIPLIPHLTTRSFVLMVGLAYLAWAPIPPAWIRRPRRVQVRFYAGGRDDEVPRAIVVAGEEEPVEVERSWIEEEEGSRRRRRRFLVRTASGSRLEILGEMDGRRWSVVREDAQSQPMRGGGQ